jgi:tellurite resistance protein
MALSISGAGSLLVRIPTALFPIALGLAGLGALAIAASDRVEIDSLISVGQVLLGLAGGMLLIDLALYLLKLLRHREEVVEDISMATRANLLAPGLMAAMVLGGVLAPNWAGGHWVWLVASIAHLLLLLNFVGRWLTHDYDPAELNPTWFLPAAGIMTSAMTWPGFGPIAFPMLTFGAGLMLWLMLLPLVFRRLVFEPAVQPQLRPTLFIVAAPFGLAAGALLTLFPDLPWQGPFVLVSGGAFFIVALVLQLRFIAAAGITLSWWATTFPVAVVASGFFRLGNAAGPIALYLGWSLLALACLTTSFAILATFRAAWCTCAKTVARAEREIEAMQGDA